jgi:hypothetical protein
MRRSSKLDDLPVSRYFLTFPMYDNLSYSDSLVAA